MIYRAIRKWKYWKIQRASDLNMNQPKPARNISKTILEKLLIFYDPEQCSILSSLPSLLFCFDQKSYLQKVFQSMYRYLLLHFNTDLIRGIDNRGNLLHFRVAPNLNWSRFSAMNGFQSDDIGNVAPDGLCPRWVRDQTSVAGSG